MDLRGQAVGVRGVGRSGLRVRAPASSANVGAGFDAIGIAVDLPFELASVESPGEGWLQCEATHPAAVAHCEAGGDGALWWRSPIPPGRGLGFSGAARVAGAFLAALPASVDSGGGDEAELGSARARALEVASALEGHPDNAAASAMGGLVVAAGGRVVRVDPPPGLTVVVWWPPTEVSTRRSRDQLPETVPFADAVANLARSALLVAAVATGDLTALDEATRDRLHQDRRLASLPASAAAMESLREAGAFAVWLSGSGPAVAAFTTDAEAPALAGASLPEGTVRVVPIASGGVELLG